VDVQVGASALTEPMIAMSNASISTPAMITIRIERSIAFTRRQDGPPV
jgi:flagellar hook-basal body complex protein FliE